MKIQKVTRRKNGGISISYQDDNGENYGLLLRPEEIIANYDAAQHTLAGGRAGVCPECGSEIAVCMMGHYCGEKTPAAKA